MKKFHINRLLKLATHLESGKLGHEIFDFNLYNYIPYERKYFRGLNVCGTRGCAIGELPICDKRNWKFNEFGSPTLRKNIGNTKESGMYYFDISPSEFNFLFQPNNYYSNKLGLPENALKEDVAQRIRNFISNKQENPKWTI